MEFIDSHCHLHDPWFPLDSIPDIVSRAKLESVNKIISCSSDPATFEQVIKSGKIDSLFVTIGLQPTLVEKYPTAKVIRDLLENTNSLIKAIGEVGLDYYWIKDKFIQDLQKKLFIDCIGLANEYNLPLVIHSRKAESDVLEILQSFSQTPVLLHSYEGNLQEIQLALDLGYLISIPTNVVIRKSRRKVAKRCGIDNIVLETDAPYCGPKEGLFPNTPSTIPFAARKLASILEMDIDEIGKITTSNAEKFYNI